MAKYRNSPWGTIQGRIGEAIGVTSRGVRFVRGLSAPSNRPPSADQMRLRKRFEKAGELAPLFYGIATNAVCNDRKGKTAYSDIFETLYQALQESGGEWKLSAAPRDFFGSRGKPMPVHSFSASREGDGTIKGTWQLENAYAGDAKVRVYALYVDENYGLYADHAKGKPGETSFSISGARIKGSNKGYLYVFAHGDSKRRYTQVHFGTI